MYKFLKFEIKKYMKSLSETWFIEGNIDFESKKYTLLAYLQRINKHFDVHELYPQLSDIIAHARNLKAFKDKKAVLQNQFPKRLTGADWENLRLLYEEMIQDDVLMEEIEEIVHYALHRMKKTINTGTEMYDYVEEHLDIVPVGILPYDNQEGYFFLNGSQSRTIQVYAYKMSIFQRAEDKYRTMRSTFINTWQRNFVNTYESIKLELLRTRKSLVLPAVYAIETELNYPMDATILPVAKRRFVRYISGDT